MKKRVIGAITIIFLFVPIINAQELKRGDVNNDGNIDLSDAIFLLDFLFQNGKYPNCIDTADTNGDSIIDISDAIKILFVLFYGEQMPNLHVDSKEDILSGALSCVSSLKSNYFNNDITAQKILSQEMIYNIEDYNLVCGGTDFMGSFDNYGFKITNALKQLGYFYKICLKDKNVALLMLNEFKERNKLPLSPYLDKNALLELDAQLVKSEERDSIGKSFICYNKIKEAPLNDASKEHVAFLYMIAINSFPEELRIKESECLNYQTFRIIQNTICPNYWSQYNYEDCTLRADNFGPGIPREDFTEVATTIHEYAHFIDIMSKKINTLPFYDISYDTTDRVLSKGWTFYKPRININDISQGKEHFFSYADGWESIEYPGYYTASEDFAVSISMYILHGIEFRDYMQDKPILAKKYSWIKENVFKGKEFNTGDPNYKLYASDLYNIRSEEMRRTIMEASGITSLRPNYIWDYKVE